MSNMGRQGTSSASDTEEDAHVHELESFIDERYHRQGEEYHTDREEHSQGEHSRAGTPDRDGSGSLDFSGWTAEEIERARRRKKSREERKEEENGIEALIKGVKRAVQEQGLDRMWAVLRGLPTPPTADQAGARPRPSKRHARSPGTPRAAPRKSTSKDSGPRVPSPAPSDRRRHRSPTPPAREARRSTKPRYSSPPRGVRRTESPGPSTRPRYASPPPEGP